jgi:RNA polymerase sigma factor (sigma-70 family)
LGTSLKAFEQYVAPLQDRMTRCIWRIVRHGEDTEDVLQESLAKIVAKMRQVERHPNPQAFILRICMQSALDHLRRSHSRKRALVGLRETRPANISHPPADELLMREEQRAWLLSALARLPSREAEAMALLVGEEMSYAEVAGAMGCRETTVRVLAWNARRRLRKELAEQGLALPEEARSHD